MKKDRTKTVLIRLTEEEKNKLQEMAEEKEMKVEPFIRRTIFSNFHPNQMVYFIFK